MSFDFVTIDFETANNNYSSACSIGLVAVKNNEIAETFYSLIQPAGLNFNEENIKIHGITADDVKDAPLFPEIWEKIKRYFEGNMLVAHNAIFDMTVLKNCLLEHNLSIPSFDYLCSIPISTRACRGEKIGQSLKDRSQHFGIEIEDHHNALCDAVTCAKLVIECVKAKKRKSFEAYCTTHSSLPVKQFQDLKPQKEFKKGKPKPKFNRVSISDIVSSKESFDTNHILYNKNIVFTGDLKTLDRKAAMQKVVNLGGIVKSGVSSKTDYLIVGVQDKSLVGEDGMSTKEEKAYELKEKGHDIKILSEDEFLHIIMPNDTLDTTLNSMIIFNDIDEKINKLKTWKLLSPTAKELKDVYYKNKNGIFKCEIMGYLSKKTNSNCMDRFYETIVIKVDDSIIKIAPSYLLEMQKKDFSVYSQLEQVTE